MAKITWVAAKILGTVLLAIQGGDGCRVSVCKVAIGLMTSGPSNFATEFQNSPWTLLFLEGEPFAYQEGPRSNTGLG
jgi:hypothetical protein